MKKTKTQKGLNLLKNFLGITILAPILIGVFFIDRIILFFIFWMQSPNMKEWSRNGDLQFFSLIRTGFVGLVYLIYLFIKYILGAGTF